MQKSVVIAGIEIKNVRIIERVSVNKRVLGTRYNFLGAKSASEIKKDLRAAKVPASQIKAKVNAILSGKASLAWVTMASLRAAEEQVVRERGGVPEFVDHNAKGTKSVTQYVFPEKVRTERAALPAPDTAAIATEMAAKALVTALGISLEEATAMLSAKPGSPATVK